MAVLDPLATQKADAGALFHALGIERGGNHCKCPICGDTCMRVSQSSDGTGAWLWQCMKGCGQGTVVDALAILQRRPVREIVLELLRKGNSPYNNRTSRPALPSPSQPSPPAQEPEKDRAILPQPKEATLRRDPVIDTAKAEAFVSYAHGELVGREELHSRWLAKRNISFDVATRYRLGFLDKYQLKIWGKEGEHEWMIHNAWVLPITDATGTLRAVKLHFEEQQGTFKGKSLWMPFGTVPARDPARGITPFNAYYTFWPPLTGQRRTELNTDAIFDMRWWLSRMSNAITQMFQQKFEFHRLCVAADVHKKLEDLTPVEQEQATQLAFDELRDVIRNDVTRRIHETADDPASHDYVVIVPGELKALTEISAGEIATSTGGDGALPQLSHFVQFRGRNILLKYDDDIPMLTKANKVMCAGRSFVHKIYPPLVASKVRCIKVFRHGRQ